MADVGLGTDHPLDLDGALRQVEVIPQELGRVCRMGDKKERGRGQGGRRGEKEDEDGEDKGGDGEDEDEDEYGGRTEEGGSRRRRTRRTSRTRSTRRRKQ